MDWTNIAYTGIGFLFGQISMVGALWGKRLVGEDAAVIAPESTESDRSGEDDAGHVRTLTSTAQGKSARKVAG
jgi:hypothetical protein